MDASVARTLIGQCRALGRSERSERRVGVFFVYVRDARMFEVTNTGIVNIGLDIGLRHRLHVDLCEKAPPITRGFM